jgi:hypothetical protein
MARESINYDFLYHTIESNLPVCKKIYENFVKTLNGQKDGLHDIN